MFLVFLFTNSKNSISISFYLCFNHFCFFFPKIKTKIKKKKNKTKKKKKMITRYIKYTLILTAVLNIILIITFYLLSFIYFSKFLGFSILFVVNYFLFRNLFGKPLNINFFFLRCTLKLLMERPLLLSQLGLLESLHLQDYKGIK